MPTPLLDLVRSDSSRGNLELPDLCRFSCSKGLAPGRAANGLFNRLADLKSHSN